MSTAPHPFTPLPHLPWRHGNAFRLLVDAEAFYPALLEAIAQARCDIRLEMYLMTSGRVADRFIEALSEAARRGVRVRLLLDAFGCLGLNQSDRQRLISQGVSLTLYNPLRLSPPLRLRRLRRNLFRDHRKLLVVDDCCAFVGGAGITDDYDRQASGRLRWHDVMVEIRGPLILDWQQVFEQNWSRWARQPPHNIDAKPATAGALTGRVSLAGSDAPAEIKRTLVNRVDRARQRIWIATAYFVPAWKLRRRLARAARKGLDVRILVPGPHTDHPAIRHAGRRFYPALLRAGVRIFEFEPRFQHAKVALIDDWVAIGSSNLDRWNLRWNLEANQEIDAPSFAAEVASMLQNDFVSSREQHLRAWHRRPWRARLAERFWGFVDRWVDRHARRKK